MALIGINPVSGGGERKQSTLEQIAAGVQIASNLLNTGLNAYETFGIKAPREQAETEYYKAQTAGLPAKEAAAAENAKLDRAYKESQIGLNEARAKRYAEGGMLEASNAKLGRAPAAAASAPYQENRPIPRMPGEIAVDKAFAKDYQDFIGQGGYATVEKNINQLGGALENLKQTDKASGPFLGNLPKAVRDVVTPSGADIQDQIESVVQTSLKQILGAQFTEKEGRAILQRAFNPRLSEQQNAARVETLLTELQEAARAKQEAADYFSTYGTLKGYKGRIVRGLQDAAPSFAAEQQSNIPAKIRVSNGREILEIDGADLQEAEKDGYKRLK